jgi:hypothetical protein
LFYRGVTWSCRGGRGRTFWEGSPASAVLLISARSCRPRWSCWCRAGSPLRHPAQPCPGFTVGAFFCGGHGTFRKPLLRPFRPSTVRVGNAGGTRAAAVRLRGHFASLLHGHAVRCRHGWRAYLGRMIKDDSMGRFEVKLPLERRRQSARGSLPVCSPQASFGVARPSLWNV